MRARQHVVTSLQRYDQRKVIRSFRGAAIRALKLSKIHDSQSRRGIIPATAAMRTNIRGARVHAPTIAPTPNCTSGSAGVRASTFPVANYISSSASQSQTAVHRVFPTARDMFRSSSRLLRYCVHSARPPVSRLIFRAGQKHPCPNSLLLLLDAAFYQKKRERREYSPTEDP